jgi:hypothetical protein
MGRNLANNITFRLLYSPDIVIASPSKTTSHCSRWQKYIHKAFQRIHDNLDCLTMLRALLTISIG